LILFGAFFQNGSSCISIHSSPFQKKSLENLSKTDGRSAFSDSLKGRSEAEFPTQYLDKTLEQIQKLAQAGDKPAKKAWKLLTDNRFRK
jgi:hypothetical protein